MKDPKRPIYISDPAELIRYCREESTMTAPEIVRVLTRSETNQSVKNLAKRFAPLLGITESEFIGIARGRKIKPTGAPR